MDYYDDIPIDTAEWTRGLWWRVLSSDGRECICSDEVEARRLALPGDRLQCVFTFFAREWRDQPLTYRAEKSFKEQQEAFASGGGDLESVAAHIRDEAVARARHRSKAVKALRDEPE